MPSEQLSLEAVPSRNRKVYQSAYAKVNLFFVLDIIGFMVNKTIQTRLFLKIWLWSLFGGVLLGLGVMMLILWLMGPAGGDEAQGFAFVFIYIVLCIGNLTSYIVAIAVGSRYVRKQNQNIKAYLTKCIPLSIAAFLLSTCILFPLLFGSLISAFIVIFSINKILPQPEVSPINTPASPNLNQAGGN